MKCINALLLVFSVCFSCAMAVAAESSLSKTADAVVFDKIEILQNKLLSKDEILKDLPQSYPVGETDPNLIVDFTPFVNAVNTPGVPQDIPLTAIRSFTEYVLGVYEDYGYSGIYVYVPAEKIERKAGRYILPENTLNIAVLETSVSDVTVAYYKITGDPNNPAELREDNVGHLNEDIVREWSPIQKDHVMNSRRLSEYLNLLNLNPDRQIEAVVSRGAEPNQVSLDYTIYEGDPLHFFVQVDNSGNNERKWNPRVGVATTNLTGRDDRAAFVWNSPIDKDIQDTYSFFGNYDFPLFDPHLRMTLYGGYSEFDMSPETAPGFNFRGSGEFVGGILKYNFLQRDGWFFDLTGSISREVSEVTPSLGINTDIEMAMWGVGLNVYNRADRVDELSDVFLSYNYIKSFAGSSPDKFADARTNATDDFSIHTLNGTYSQYLDKTREHRFLGSARYIVPEKRLVPAKLTTFGGLYTVRGYDEEAVVADGGLLLSGQYEYDLIADWYDVEDSQYKANERFLNRLALVAFWDYAIASVKDPVPGEDANQNFSAYGFGTVMTAKNFDVGVYYGIPVEKIEGISDDGRWSFNFTMRW